MSERLRESLSALMDDEADDLELGRILRAMDSEESDLGAIWSRYQLVSAVLKGSPSSPGLRPLTLAVVAAEAEASDGDASEGGGVSEGMSALGGAAPAERGRTRRALGSFAVAASITAVAVVGWQWQGGMESESAQMATGTVVPAPATAPAVSALPNLRVPDQRGLLQASEPGRGGRDLPRSEASGAVTRSDSKAVDMRKQVEAYMVRHAEHNALYSRSGMMPFARMAAFDGAQ